jgi:hypothetical protein
MFGAVLPGERKDKKNKAEKTQGQEHDVIKR